MQSSRKYLLRGAALLLASLVAGGPALAQSKPGKNGTTLAASKTVDICEVSPGGDWRYSGIVSVWNAGAIPTTGLMVMDRIEYKESGPNWQTGLGPVNLNSANIQIDAGTTELTATLFPYSFDGDPLPGTIRNVAKVTITNHSGSAGTATGPEPKATWTGPVLPCAPSNGCVRTQGYWGNHSNWPTGYSPSDTFFYSGQTWQQVLDSSAAGGNAYYQLAHQYIAAKLNEASGAAVPAGVLTVLADSQGFFNNVNTTPASCGGSACGLQKTWAGILDEYNNGDYPGGPEHCE